MGQGQLLIIILGVIVVGIAIAVGISMFQGDQPPAEAVEFYDYQSQISIIGLIRQIAERDRDMASGKYVSADSIIHYCVSTWGWKWGQLKPDHWTAKLFRMDSAGVKLAKPNAIGVWVYHDEYAWCTISAFGQYGDLIATTDNFNDEQLQWLEGLGGHGVSF